MEISVFLTTTKLVFYTVLRLEKGLMLCYITVRKGDTNVQVKPQVPKITEPDQAITLEGKLIPACKRPAKGMMNER